MTSSESKESKKAITALTVRNVPVEVDETITMLARAAGKSKSDFLQEFLTAEFSDLIKNFSRSSELVALMDKEISRFTGVPLSGEWYDNEFVGRYNRAYCSLLGISSPEDLQRIMMANVPFLEARAGQIQRQGMMSLGRGISLTFALYAEMAGRDKETVHRFYPLMFNEKPNERFYTSVNALRVLKNLEPVSMKKSLTEV